MISCIKMGRIQKCINTSGKLQTTQILTVIIVILGHAGRVLWDILLWNPAAMNWAHSPSSLTSWPEKQRESQVYWMIWFNMTRLEWEVSCQHTSQLLTNICLQLQKSRVTIIVRLIRTSLSGSSLICWQSKTGHRSRVMNWSGPAHTGPCKNV